MRLPIVLALFFYSGMAAAQSPVHSQPLLKYIDCAESYVPDLPLFLAGRNFHVGLKGADFLQGVQVSVLTDSKGDLAALQIGPNITIPMDTLYGGLRFGFPPFPRRGKTLHTLEVLADFNPATGGKIRFGHLKNLTVSQIIEALVFGDPAVNNWEQMLDLAKDLGVSGRLSLGQAMRKYYGEEWGEFTFYVRKENERWVARGRDGQVIEEIYTLFEVSRLGQVKGLVDMLAVGPIGNVSPELLEENYLTARGVIATRRPEERPRCYRPSR